MQAEQQQQRQRTVQRRHGSSSTMDMAVRHSPPIGKPNFAHQISNMPITGPICFLVREQAKNVVAIKGLKNQVEALENVQEAVFKAIHDFQAYRENPQSSPYQEVLNPEPLFGIRRRIATVPQLNLIAKSDQKTRTVSGRYIAEMESKTNIVKNKNKEDFGKGDADNENNKQDSGVDSDCQNPMSISHVPHLSRGATALDESEDELCVLLDVLAIKGAQLRQQVEELENEPSDVYAESTDISGVSQKCRDLQRKLNETLTVNEGMFNKINFLENLLDKLQMDRVLMGQELEKIMKDKSQLEITIHDLYKRFYKSNSKNKDSTLEPSHVDRKEIDSKMIRQKCSESSRAKVLAALKETNYLELQKNLLLCIMENEVLNTKADLAEKAQVTSVEESKKTEFKLKEDITQLALEKRQFSELCEQKRKELNAALEEVSSSRTKISHMEKEIQELNTRRVHEVETMRVDLTPNHSEVDISRSVKRQNKVCQSLPPALAIKRGERALSHYLHEIHPFGNSGSGYLNITSEYPNEDCGVEEMMNSPVYIQRSSTPIRPRILPCAKHSSTFVMESPSHSQHNLLDVDESDLPSNSFNSLLHQSIHLETIRQFDPLSITSGDTSYGKNSDTTGYVDSLDPRSKDNNDSCLLSTYNTTKKTKGVSFSDRSSELMSFDDLKYQK